MSAIDQLFQELRASGRKALMPFVTAADPDLDFTAAVVRTLSEAGCHLCELGIPYSDPIADGPVIQASYTRVLQHGTRLDDIFQTLRSLPARPRMPLVSMVSYSIVHRRGLANYVAAAKKAGIAGAIVPDLPLEEARPLATICRREDFSLIPLVTPTTARDRALRIAESATGFLYYVSVSGVTGQRSTLPPDIIENVAQLRRQTDLPICIGFGINTPEHVRMLAPVADGLIVGSAIVQRVAEANELPRQDVLTSVGQYVHQLLDALREVEHMDAG